MRTLTFIGFISTYGILIVRMVSIFPDFEARLIVGIISMILPISIKGISIVIKPSRKHHYTNIIL